MRTTIADPTATRPPDLADRQFGVSRTEPVARPDFTYVIDASAGAIAGWEAFGSKQTRFVESAIRQAAALRSRQGYPIDGAIRHSDAGSQYTSMRFGETLSLSGIRPTIGSVGDALWPRP